MSTGRGIGLGRSHLFLVRVRLKRVGDGETECHGKVQRVVDGESHQFDSWQALVDLLLVMLPGSKEGRTPEDKTGQG